MQLTAHLPLHTFQVLFILCLCLAYEDLKLPEGSTWKVGVFQNHGILPLEETPRENIFDFDKKCNVTVVFHEVYQELEVAICRQVDQMKANFRTLLPGNIWANTFFRNHCVRMFPHKSPVITNYEGPILMVVLTNGTVHIKDRAHLRERSGLAFNATYELRLKSVIGMNPHIDPSIVAKHSPCETNGIPVLVPRNDSFYEYICDCKYSTYGPNCEWGPLCPRNKQRELCSFRGTCKQRGDVRTCICDSEDYHGSDCIPYTFFPFSNCCPQENGNCCHRVPPKAECLCAKEFKMTNDGQCIRDTENYPMPKSNLSDQPIIKSISSSHSKEMLEMCCVSCQRNANYTFYKDGHVINEIPVNKNSSSVNQNVWKRGEIEIFKLNDGTRKDVMMCLWIRNYSEDDFGIYSCNVQNGIVNETRKHYLINRKKYMRISPRRLTIFKGDNTYVKCRVLGAPFLEYSFNFTWNVSPRSNFDSISIEPYFFQGSNIFIKNIKGDLNIECSTRGEELSEDYFLQITEAKVINKNDKYCGEQDLDGIKWKIAAVGDLQEALCPIGYSGTCFRKCYININEIASWDLQDCSNCRNTQLVAIFKGVRSYRKGIKSYGKYSGEVLPNLVEFLESSTFLGGELGYVVKWLQQTISIEEFSATYETFNRAISLFTEKKHSLNSSGIYELENLIRKSAQIWNEDTCRQKYYNDTNIISLMVKPIEKSKRKFKFIFDNLSPKLEDRDSNCKNIEAKEGEIQIDVAKDYDVAMLSLTMFKKSSNIVPFMKKVHNDTWEYPSTGNVSSALLQMDIFDANHTEIPSDNVQLIMKFGSCQMIGHSNGRDSPWILGCSMYLPQHGYWNASKCKMQILSDGGCSCSCSGTVGWLGLVCYREENYMISPLGETNLCTVLGCSISSVFLSIAIITLLSKLQLNWKESSSYLVETTSVLIVNAVFLYQAISEPQLNENLALLITISSFLVLCLGVSLSHHVSIIQKCSIHDPLLDESANPSFLVVIISFLSAAMLGVIIWTISKVQKTNLTRSWLPNTEASILTLVVLCYIYALAFMLISIAIYNYFRILRLSAASPKKPTDALQVEFRNKCLISVLHLVFIFSSFYQDGDTGSWIFSLSAVVLGAALFLFYTTDRFWQKYPAFCDGTCCFKKRTGNHIFSSQSCWNTIFTPYSGVTKSDADEVNMDDVPISHNSSSSGRKYSYKINGSCRDCVVEEILVHRTPADKENLNRNEHGIQCSADLSANQYILKTKHGDTITEDSLQHREYVNCLTGVDISVDRNYNRKESGKISTMNRNNFAKHQLKISSSFASKNSHLAQLSVRNKGMLSRFSSKFSLPGSKYKYLGKGEYLFLPLASSENFNVRCNPQNSLGSTMNPLQKGILSKNCQYMHRRQYSL